MSRWRPVLGIAARILVGGAFLFAGASKLVSIDPFVSALDWVATLLRLSPPWLDAAREIVPRAEVVLGLCLLTGLYLRPALYVAAGVLLTFLGLLVAGSLQPRGISACGCFGAKVLDSGGPLLWIARDGGLAILAFTAAVFGRARFALDSVLGPRRTLDGEVPRIP